MKTSAEVEYAFRHAVMQEVAYQLQPPSVRSAVHSVTVSILEEVYQGELEDHALELADHAYRAHEHETRKEVTRALQAQEVRYLKLAGELARRRYDNEQAVTVFTRLADLPWASPGIRFYALVEVAEVMLDTVRFDEAQPVVHRCLNLSRENGDPAQQSRAMLLLARLASARGERADAATYGQQADSYAQQTNDPTVELRVCSDLGVVWFRRGDIQLAQQLFDRAVMLAREQGEREMLASALNRAGACRVYRNELEDGEEMLAEAYKEAGAIGHLRHLAAITMNQGVLLRRQQRLEEALQVYEKSKEMSLKIGALENLANCIDNSGVVLNLLGRFDEAAEAHDQARELALELGDRRKVANSTLNRALISRKRGNYDEAYRLITSALETAKSQSDVRLTINALINRGNLLLSDLDRPFEALHDFVHAEIVAGEIGDDPNVRFLKTRQAHSLFEMGQLEACVRVCTRLRHESEDSEDFPARIALFWECQALAALGESDSAIDRGHRFLAMSRPLVEQNTSGVQDIETIEGVLSNLGADAG